MVTQHQLRWFGHVIRMSQERLSQKILYGQLHLGRRSTGGQMKHYKDQLKMLLKMCNINPTYLDDAAADGCPCRKQMADCRFQST